MLCWRNYFPNAVLYGFEYNELYIERAKKNNLNNTNYFFINVNQRESIRKSLSDAGCLFDVIIDDSTHNFDDQINIVFEGYKFLKNSGLLIIEDIFINEKEERYAEALKTLEPYFSSLTFIFAEHSLKNSTGWNNDKLLILRKNAPEIFLNIITPCSRPENLKYISESINIPRENYRWIVVFDGENIPINLPTNCEAYTLKDEKSVSGNAQRNYGIELIHSGCVYFNDDDTIIHKDLWNNIHNLIDTDMIVFSQECKGGALRLAGDSVALGSIDSHNFIVSIETIGDARWITDRYNADGIFAEDCYKKSNKIKYIPKVLSTYNSLR